MSASRAFDYSVSAVADSTCSTGEATQHASAADLLEKDTDFQKRWGIILAGGDGNRLRALTRFISGDDRPKQFCRVLGQHTLFEQTRHRVAHSIPGRQTILALTITHQSFYGADLCGDPAPKLIQPINRGTAPPILLSLLRIVRHAPDAMVAVLPSDHYFSDEAVFASTLDAAFRIAHTQRESVVLLGARPSRPDPEFGWVDLGAVAGQSLFRVRAFEEKPNIGIAEKLFKSGALWNTFVMVGRVTSFLWMAFLCQPELLTQLNDWLPNSIDMTDLYVPSSLYERIPTSDFSHHVLSRNAYRLLVLRLNKTEWHDLGNPSSVFSVLHLSRDDKPNWIHTWEAARLGQLGGAAGQGRY